MAEPGPEPDARTLLALQERLDRATAAAERLLADAAGGGTAHPGPGDPGPASPAPGDSEPGDRAPVDPGPTPAGGWQRPREREPARESRWIAPEDGELLLSLAGLVLDRIPADLQRRLAHALRELLLAVRALLDWALERAERRAARPVEVQDIPIL